MSPEDATSELRRATVLPIALGLLLVVGGIVGLIYVLLATITSAILFAWLLMVAGLVALVDAWRRRGKDGFWASAITGVANLAAGMIIVWKPAESLVALTMLVAVFLLLGGMFRLLIAFAAGITGSGWIVLHGVVDIVLAVLIISNLPTASFYVLGVMLSVSLLVDGTALVVLGAAAHRGLGRIAAFARTQEMSGSPRHA
jgi:uncharacterized membrane protein HdeD (DUF308 family)